MNNPRILAFITLCIWSFSTTLMRLISTRSQFILLSLSFSFTFVTIIIYLLLSEKENILRKISEFNKKYLFFGLFGYFIYTAALIQCFVAFDSASEPTVLNYTWPVFTVIFTELFFRRSRVKPSGRIIEGFGVFLGFMAIFILGTEGDIVTFRISNIKGIVYGLIAGASYGFYSGYSSRVPKEDHSIFLLASIFIGLVCMSAISYSEVSLISSFTLKDVLIVATFGCFGNGIGYITWTKANRTAFEQNVRISSVASIMFFLPLTSLVVVSVLLKEAKLLQPYFIVSLVLLILSSVICQNSEKIGTGFRK